MAKNSQCRIHFGKVTALLDQLPREGVFGGYTVKYRVGEYKNILGGFEIHCN